MEFLKTPVRDVLLIKPEVHGDHRGFFMETFRTDCFAQQGITLPFVQDNHSQSDQGTLRGLHYQKRRPQGKLLRAVSGSIFDVAVDIRRGSPTFGKWFGAVLSAENKLMLWVPPGFAHGFYTLENGSTCFYKCTDYYDPKDECGIRWDDPDLKIAWPLIDNKKPFLSAKDAAAKSFNQEVLD